MNSAVTILTV